MTDRATLIKIIIIIPYRIETRNITIQYKTQGFIDPAFWCIIQTGEYI